MKNWQFKFLFAALALCVLTLSLQSFGGKATLEEKAEIEALNTGSGMYAQVGGYVRTNYRQDTITDGEKDTIALFSRNSTTLANSKTTYTPFLSLYTLDLSIVKTNVSGTTTVALYLDKSATTTPTTTGWVFVDSTAVATSGATQIRTTDLTGEIYRLRVSGRGTQSTIYKINGIAKKKN